MKYTYTVESFYLEKWAPIIRGESRDYCLGYFDRTQEFSPRNAYRVVRSDGKVMAERKGDADVSIGMIAGWPTPEQYEGAAQRALDQAKRIRERQALEEARRESRLRP